MALPLIPIIGAFLLAPSVIRGAFDFYPPFAALLARRSYRDNPDLLPTVEQTVTALVKGDITPDTYYSMMAQTGLSQEIATMLHRGARQLLTTADYIAGWRRGLYNETERDQRLSSIGITGETINDAIKITEYYPNPEDIVRFAVREVYNPQVRQSYGLDEDISEQYLETARRGGLSEAFARDYWASHWELPSPTQGYEMLHRVKAEANDLSTLSPEVQQLQEPETVISQEELRGLLKALDIMPAWRDKLTAISYNPLTRVDVRRMHKMGVLTLQQTYNAYRSMGSNDIDARYLTEFTRRYNEGVEGEAPKSTILQAYKLGTYDRDRATQALTSLGLQESEIRLSLDNIDQALEEERLDLAADSEVDRYIAGDISLDTLRTTLIGLGVPSRRIDIVIARELAQAAKRVRRVPESTLQRWLSYGIITDEGYRERMRLLRYAPADIESYLLEAKLDMERTGTRHLSAAQYLKLYVEGYNTDRETIERLTALQYSPEDIEDMMRQAEDKAKRSGNS